LDLELLGKLEASISSMPPKRREIFLAKRLDGMSYLEIADATGLTVRQIEHHMAKALIHIMKQMDSESTPGRAGLTRRVLRFLTKFFGGMIARRSSRYGRGARPHNLEVFRP
jgi:RNA polymerase sigma-70 factor (ECF subfamily)